MTYQQNRLWDLNRLQVHQASKPSIVLHQMISVCVDAIHIIRWDFLFSNSENQFSFSQRGERERELPAAHRTKQHLSPQPPLLFLSEETKNIFLCSKSSAHLLLSRFEFISKLIYFGFATTFKRSDDNAAKVCFISKAFNSFDIANAASIKVAISRVFALISLTTFSDIDKSYWVPWFIRC